MDRNSVPSFSKGQSFNISVLSVTWTLYLLSPMQLLPGVTGGIRSALQEQVSMKRMGVISALKCLYWLVKEGVAHQTKFGSLLELAKSIGCLYLCEQMCLKEPNILLI